MSSDPTLDNLPGEIQLHIFSQIGAHDLSTIARTSKRLNQIATSLLWNDIELREEGYHESRHEIKVPPPARDPACRPYHPKQKWGNGQGACMKAYRFFEMLQIMHKKNPDRLQQITQRSEEQVSKIVGSPPKLRFLKLSGYMPREVPAWLLREADTLERLELDMLDRPISTYLSNDPHFTPLPCEKTNTDYGSLADDMVVPRPLGNIFKDYGNHEVKLPKLRHLFLGKPAESYSDSTWAFERYSLSKRAEKACYDDWFRILEASLKTLETLVLEQRPAIDDIESDGHSEDTWMDERLWSEASEILLEMVQTVISSETSQLPLKRVYLYGIVNVSEELVPPFLDLPPGKFMQFLKDRGVECEARRGKWCFFDRQSGSVDWCPWDAAYEDEEEDEDEDEDEDTEPLVKWDTVMAKVDNRSFIVLDLKRFR
ncbi:hypothetical protein FMUND_3246 [Fusarium mundagurra]|uniref:F-box domain-containing protein n=1 Tax=Fusarium mundagurra TaxID=1567541 RepID=A0A8H6DLK9_9HYPO|nr:hypothetical protein FMUND_3246 [Fusarium mundagurra]